MKPSTIVKGELTPPLRGAIFTSFLTPILTASDTSFADAGYTTAAGLYWIRLLTVDASKIINDDESIKQRRDGHT